jgi:hypothetical protein
VLIAAAVTGSICSGLKLNTMMELTRHRTEGVRGGWWQREVAVKVRVLEKGGLRGREATRPEERFYMKRVADHCLDSRSAATQALIRAGELKDDR